MLKVLTILFRECEVGITHDAARGFSAIAKGPFGVLALIVICTVAAYFFNK